MGINHSSGREKMSWRIRVFPTLSVVSSVMLLILGFVRDTVIVEMGVRAYTSIRNVIIGTLVISFTITAIMLVFRLIRNHRDRTDRIKQDAQIRDENDARDKAEKEYLSVRGHIDSANIRRKLKSALNDGYSEEVNNVLWDCIDDLDDMDKYQKKLHSLLDKNGESALASTLDMVDGVEQYVCKNIRRILNYLEVTDSNDDMTDIIPKFTSRCKDNDEKIEKVKDFLYTMVDFLNNQGASDISPEMLEMFTKNLSDAIVPEPTGNSDEVTLKF